MNTYRPLSAAPLFRFGEGMLGDFGEIVGAMAVLGERLYVSDGGMTRTPTSSRCRASIAAP